MHIPALKALTDADLADLEATFGEDAHDPDASEVDRAACARALAAVRAEQDRRLAANMDGRSVAAQVRALVCW